MINRKITLLGPEGTNIYVIFQFLLFNVISWFTLFNITSELSFNLENILVRQIIFTILGLFVFFFFTYIPISNIVSLSNVLMISSTFLLLGVLFTEESLGARRRYDLGIFDFQPSEFTKVIFVIFLANTLASKSNNIFKLGLIVTNLLLIYIQPDLGTTVILVLLVFLLFFLTDVKFKSLTALLLFTFFTFFVLLEFNLVNTFQIDRITDFYSNEIKDFSQQQSRLQISLGGFLGENLSNTSSIDIFVPVQTTDFIFSSFSKSFGFFGCIFLLGFWAIFGLRVYLLIIKTDSDFEKFLLSGFIILIYLQIFINIATVLGLIPLTGDPFPLLSLGGSSIIAISSIFGIINRIFIENNLVI
jgi:rod shape determining protein RodA